MSVAGLDAVLHYILLHGENQWSCDNLGAMRPHAIFTAATCHWCHNDCLFVVDDLK